MGLEILGAAHVAVSAQVGFIFGEADDNEFMQEMEIGAIELLWHQEEKYLLLDEVTPVGIDPPDTSNLVVLAPIEMDFPLNEDLVLFLTRPYDGTATPSGRWQVLHAIYADGSSLVGGSSGAANAQLGGILGPGETDVVAALVELTDQLAVSASAELALEAPAFSLTAPDVGAGSTDRIERVFGQRHIYRPRDGENTGAGELPEGTVSEFLEQRPELRQLFMQSDEIPDGLGQRLGVEWQWYDFVMHVDTRSTVTYAWLAVEFAGVGMLGPVLVPADGTGIVPLVGFGPAGVAAQVIGWRSIDAPDFSDEKLLSTREVVSSLRGLDMAKADDVGYLIPLTGGKPVVDVMALSRSDYDALIAVADSDLGD